MILDCFFYFAFSITFSCASNYRRLKKKANNGMKQFFRLKTKKKCNASKSRRFKWAEVKNCGYISDACLVLVKMQLYLSDTIE